MGTLGGSSSRCSTMSPGQSRGFICQPPLVNNRQISDKIKNIPKCQNFDGAPLLGFSHMVAPINKAPSPKVPLPANSPNLGNVPKLPRDFHASTKVAPPLHTVLRQMLQSQEVKGEIVENFLSHSPSISRYDSAFRALWVIL